MIELGIPAMFAAGLVASPHCSLMCGALQQLPLQRSGRSSVLRSLLPLHAGRIAAYAGLGALAGGGGQGLLRLLPRSHSGMLLQLAAAAVLIGLGLRRWRQPSAACCTPRPAPQPWRRVLQGMAWALIPCAWLYLALATAALSASPLLGAALLAAFGLGTTPLLALSGWSFSGAGLAPSPRLAAALMIGVGLAGFVAAAAMPSMGSLWCLPQ